MSSLSTHTPVHPAAGAEITADAEASTAVSSADLSFAEGLRYVTTQDAPATPWEAGHTPSLTELREHFGPIFDRIALGASEREAHRVLPFVEIAELNRAGFTVLHPIEGVAGAPLRVGHSDGSVEDGHFPALIAPWLQ